MKKFVCTVCGYVYEGEELPAVKKNKGGKAKC